MPRPPRLSFTARARTVLAWLLLLALPVQGLSSAVVEMLGTRHVHRAVAEVSAMAGWQDFRRSAHALDGAPRVHSHGLFQRHHHDASDATVLALDGGGDAPAGEGGPGGGASLVLMAPLSGGLEPASPGMVAVRWPRLAASAIESREADRLERPPRA